MDTAAAVPMESPERTPAAYGGRQDTSRGPAERSWRGVVVFLLLAYGLAWAAQIGTVLMLRGRAGAALGSGLLVIAALLMWPPAVGAFVARKWVEGGNFRDAGLRWAPWHYMAAAWLGPALMTLAAMALSLPLYPFDPSFAPLQEMARQTGQDLPAPPAVIVLAQIVSGVTLGTLINSVFAFGEEFGWRGYLLPRLMGLLGPWRGLLAHGAIWGFWHAPLIALAGHNYPDHRLLGVPLFMVFGMLMGAFLAWLQLASRSVIAPTIGHAALNAIGGLPLLVLRGVDPAVGGVLYSPVGWIVLLLVLALLVRAGQLPVPRGPAQMGCPA